MLKRTYRRLCLPNAANRVQMRGLWREGGGTIPFWGGGCGGPVTGLIFNYTCIYIYIFIYTFIENLSICNICIYIRIES